MKLFMAKKNEVAKVSPQILENQVKPLSPLSTSHSEHVYLFLQVLLQDFVRALVEDLADNKDYVDDIPVAILECSKRVNALLKNPNVDDIVAFMLENNRVQVVVKALKTVLIEKGNKALPKNAKWNVVQRLFYCWNAITSYSIKELKDTFAAFKEPNQFEAAVLKLIDLVKDNKTEFDDVIGSWIPEEADGVYFAVKSNEDVTQLVVKNVIAGTSIDLKDSKVD